MILLIVKISIAIVLALWLSTIRFFKPTQGQLAVLTYFNKHVMVIGAGVPKFKIKKEIFDVPGKRLIIRIGGQRAWYLTIFPFGIASFEYRLKKFRTLAEVTKTGGDLRWQPLIPKDDNGKLLKTENDPKTIVLGEWKETKSSLFFREREEVAIRFLTVDGYRGTAFAYLKYLVWDMSAAISTTYQFKVDPEKSVIDKFES